MKYALNTLCSLEHSQHSHFGDIFYVKKSTHRDDVIIVDSITAEIFEQVRSNNTIDDTVDKNSARIERLVSENILVPLQSLPSKTIVPIATRINLWLQVTDSCNLACDYCYIPSLYSKKKMRSDIFSLLLQHLRSIKGLETVNLKLAGGEPFITFSEWVDGVQWLRKELADIGITLELRVITNLTRLTREMITFLKMNKVVISVSVDGVGETHDQHRKYKNGSGSFKTVVSNINRLKEQGVNPSVMITITSDNYHGIPDLVEYLIDRDMVFRVSDVKGGCLSPSQFEETMNKVNTLLEKALEKGYPVSRRVVFSDLRTQEAASTPCSMGSHAAAIYLDGSVYFCHTEFQKGQPLGHIDGDKNLLSIIRSGKQKHFGLSDDCQHCQYRFVCAGGCPLYRINGKSPMCHVYKKIISQVFDIYDKEDGK